MRYPFIQVRQDTRAKALDLATLLGVSDQLVRGQLEDLVVWVLDRSPEDAPPSAVVTGEDAATLIEGAVRWKRRGQRGAWVAKAITARLLAPRDGGGVELAAELIEPYVAAWHEKQAAKVRADKARERAATAQPPEPARIAPDFSNAVRESSAALREAAANVSAPYADVHRQTQTQTQTQKESARASDAGGLVNGIPLGECIETAFRSARGGRAFRWGPKEHEALRRLLNEHEPQEILRRFRIGLDARYKTINGLVDLERCWNDHAQAPPERDGRPRPTSRTDAPTGPPCAVDGCGEPTEDKARAAKGVCLGCGNEWQAAWNRDGCPGADFGAAHFARWLTNMNGASRAKEAV